MLSSFKSPFNFIKLFYVSCLTFAGVSGEAADIRGDRNSSCELEADRAGSDPPRLQGVGWPGRLEHRLLPNTEGYHCGRHVRVEPCTELMVHLNCTNAISQDAWSVGCVPLACVVPVEGYGQRAGRVSHGNKVTRRTPVKTSPSRSFLCGR